MIVVSNCFNHNFQTHTFHFVECLVSSQNIREQTIGLDNKNLWCPLGPHVHFLVLGGVGPKRDHKKNTGGCMSMKKKCTNKIDT